jgi:N-acetylglucosamine kinase-like BadF-type ATPase
MVGGDNIAPSPDRTPEGWDGMELVVGVDGGNSKTLAVVSDAAGRSLGIGRGGCGCWEGIGEQAAAQTIGEVIDQALEMAGGQRRDLMHAHMGLAGIDWPDDIPRMEGALQQAGWQCSATLENDAFLPVRACAPEGHGIGVSAGSGTAAGIIRPDGETYFYGAYTDMGGGRDIDAQMLQAAIRAEDGRGPDTALTGQLIQATGHESLRDLVYDMHRRGYYPSHHVMRPILFTTAAEGDPVACEIVGRFAGELALCATNLIGRYDLQHERPAVVAAGSLFVRTGGILFDAFREALLDEAPGAQVILADRPPVMGAFRGALHACVWDGSELWERVNEAAAEKQWFEGDTPGGTEAPENDG